MTIDVDLGGATFRLEEAAFLALRSYLDRARERLGAHPDRNDVIAGLERSIGAKLKERAAGTGSGTIDETTMAAALKDVGRVDGPDLDSSGATPADRTPSSPRRLYRLREGAMLAGVCAGLGAYVEIDANLIRLLFIIGALVSGGIVLIAYLVLMFIVPIALTEAEVAAAHSGARRVRRSG